MRSIALTLMFFFGVTSIVAVTVNETEFGAARDSVSSNATERKGRHLAESMMPPKKKTKRQVIRFPGTISTLKIVQPPLNLRSNRAPQQFSRFPTTFRSGAPWKSAVRKSPTNFDFPMDGSLPIDQKKVKRNLKNPRLKEDFYSSEADADFEEERFGQKKVNKYRSVIKRKRKRPKQNVPEEFWANHNHEDDAEMEESSPFHGYASVGSTVRMQQVAAPTFFPQSTTDISGGGSFPGGLVDGSHVPALNIRNLPTKGRQVQPMFAQLYTTHNPHVATNFGLKEPLQQNAVTLHGAKSGSANADPHYFPHMEGFRQPMAAASTHKHTSVPARTPTIQDMQDMQDMQGIQGIQVIQPPQFRDMNVQRSRPSHPSRLMGTEPREREESSSQKATMRDILDQDCPSHDVMGYCDSPPRYPMQQMKNIVKKCSNLMDAMNAQPSEESLEAHTFAKRVDDDLIRSNKSVSVDLGVDEQLNSWSRSASDGFSACNSAVELLEPGYAKEVDSGKWFVIVQHPDTTIQRIATEMCRNPGKPCGGLSELKCVKGKGTQCVQRHTHQRLISWDPENPEDCPRMRVFRFPSACICHLGVA